MEKQKIAHSPEDINWTLEASPRIDILGLDDREVFAYCHELQNDNRWLRETLHESVSMLHRTNVQLDRATRDITDLRQIVRDLRQAHERAA